MTVLQATAWPEELAPVVTPRPDGRYAVASRTTPGQVYTTTPTTCDCEAATHGVNCWHREAVLLYRRREEAARRLELKGVPFLLPAGEPVIGTRQQVRDQLSDWGCWSDGALWFTHDRAVAVAPGIKAPPGLAIGALILERWWGKRRPRVREVTEAWVAAAQRGFAELQTREQQWALGGEPRSGHVGS